MRIALIIIVFLLVGYFAYSFVPYKYTNNCKPILEFLFEELNLINEKLKDESLTEKQKEDLNSRKEEIQMILNKFCPNLSKNAELV